LPRLLRSVKEASISALFFGSRSSTAILRCDCCLSCVPVFLESSEGLSFSVLLRAFEVIFQSCTLSVR
jgi:hypothetical protein